MRLFKRGNVCKPAFSEIEAARLIGLGYKELGATPGGGLSGVGGGDVTLYGGQPGVGGGVVKPDDGLSGVGGGDVKPDDSQSGGGENAPATAGDKKQAGKRAAGGTA